MYMKESDMYLYIAMQGLKLQSNKFYQWPRYRGTKAQGPSILYTKIIYLLDLNLTIKLQHLYCNLDFKSYTLSVMFIELLYLHYINIDIASTIFYSYKYFHIIRKSAHHLDDEINMHSTIHI